MSSEIEPAPHIDHPETHAALKAAFRDQLAGVLTEPLKVTELAKWFRCHRSKVGLILDKIPGAERALALSPCSKLGVTLS